MEKVITNQKDGITNAVIDRRGNSLYFTKINPDTSTNILDPGVYELKYDPTFDRFYLDIMEEFKLPNKIYGDQSIINRWIKSWRENSQKNMGILLSGLKGSGKTITAQKFCVELNRPVIIVREPYARPSLTEFLTNPILRDSVIFIDEYEKIYARGNETAKAQDFLLSIMDGMYDTKFIFLLTINEERISEYLINRLGRVKYRKHYDNLPDDIISDVIDDLLVNKNHKAGLIVNLKRLGIITFDLITNIIKEMNLFQEDSSSVMKHLNLKKGNIFGKAYLQVFGSEFYFGYEEVNENNSSFSFNYPYDTTKVELLQNNIMNAFRASENYSRLVKYFEEIKSEHPEITNTIEDVMVYLKNNIISIFCNTITFEMEKTSYSETNFKIDDVEYKTTYRLSNDATIQISFVGNIRIAMQVKSSNYYGNAF